MDEEACASQSDPMKADFMTIVLKQSGDDYIEGKKARPRRCFSWLTALDAEPTAEADSFHDWCTIYATQSHRSVWVNASTTIVLMLLSLFVLGLQVFCLWATVYVSLGRFTCSSDNDCGRGMYCSPAVQKCQDCSMVYFKMSPMDSYPADEDFTPIYYRKLTSEPGDERFFMCPGNATKVSKTLLQHVFENTNSPQYGQPSVFTQTQNSTIDLSNLGSDGMVERDNEALWNYIADNRFDEPTRGALWCLSAAYCELTDLYADSCDYVEISLRNTTFRSVIVIMVAALLLALPIVKQADSEAGGNLLLHYRARNMRRTWLRVYVLFVGEARRLLRMYFLAPCTVVATISLLITSSLTAANILISFLAVVFVCELDKMFTGLFISPRLTLLGTEMELLSQRGVRVSWLGHRIVIILQCLAVVTGTAAYKELASTYGGPEKPTFLNRNMSLCSQAVGSLFILSLVLALGGALIGTCISLATRRSGGTLLRSELLAHAIIIVFTLAITFGLACGAYYIPHVPRNSGCHGEQC